MTTAEHVNHWKLAQQMEESFNQVGSSMMSVDLACKLLAFTYVLGGEITVLHKGLNAAIAIAAQKFKIKGGEVPDFTHKALMMKYIKEMEATGEDTEWLEEIYTRYEILPPKKKRNVKSKDRGTEGQGSLDLA